MVVDPTLLKKRFNPMTKKREYTSTTDIEDCISSRRLYHSDSYHLVSKEENVSIQKELLNWYHVHKRTNMPWRKDNDASWTQEQLGQRAYEVWVSEIMLQQTQVATVIDYYNRWMAAFPTLTNLAHADLETVNTLWAGLGYYSRAKRLWEGAKKVLDQFNGLLPSTAAELEKHIPGVGRYTAGAIASIVFGQQTPLVDGNVIRVLARWRAIHADPKKSKATVELFWEIAARIVPESEAGDFNQALMELGARVCTPQKPGCEKCPIQLDCRALKQLEVVRDMAKDNILDRGENKKRRHSSLLEHECSVCHELQSDLGNDDYHVTRYPLKVDKKPPRDEECAVSIVERISSVKEAKYLISRRPDTGLLAGLWEFPSLELDTLNTDYRSRAIQSDTFLKKKYGLDLLDISAVRHDLNNVVHLFSHIRKVYHIEWIQYQQEDEENEQMEVEGVKWVTLDELKASPIPTGLKKALKLLEKFKSTNSTTLTKKSVTIKKSIKTADISSFFVQRQTK